VRSQNTETNGRQIGPAPLDYRWLTLDRVVIISLPFMFHTSATGSLHIAVADLVFPVLVILALLNLATERRSLAFRPVIFFALIMLTVVASSALTASLSDPEFSVKLAAQNSFKLVVVLAYFVVFAIHGSRLERDQLYGLLRTWGWTATILSLATIATAAGLAIVPVDRWEGVRSVGFFQDPNLYGGYLLISLSVVVAAEVMKRSNWAILQILSIMAAILLTASRGAFGSLALVLTVALILVASWKARLIIAGVGLAAGSLLYAVGPGRVGSWLGIGSWLGPAIDRLDTSGQRVGDDPRLRLWARAISLWNDHPLFGVGIGQFGRFTIDVNGIDKDNVGQIAHNTFVSFLVETGIFGLLLWVAGIACLAVRLYRDQRLEIRLKHAFGLGILAICTEMSTLNLQNVRYVWVFAGLVWGFTVWKSQGCRRLGHSRLRRCEREIVGGDDVGTGEFGAGPVGPQRCTHRFEGPHRLA
jgi:O-antigen ligase